MNNLPSPPPSEGGLRGVEAVRAPTLESQTLAFLAALEAQGDPPIYTLAPAEARNLLLDLQTSGHVAKQPVAIEDRTINTGPTGTISLRIVRPAGSGGLLPGVIYFHGGGGSWEIKKHMTGWCASW